MGYGMPQQGGMPGMYNPQMQMGMQPQMQVRSFFSLSSQSCG